MQKLIKDKIIIGDLNNILTILYRKGIITSYEFKIMPYYAQNEIKVYLNLTTCYMVKTIQLCSVIDVEFAEEE